MTIFMFVLYLVFMLSIGVYFYKQGKDDDTLSGYLLGGRELNPFVAAISAGASDMSGWLLMGLPGAAYVSGYSAGWIGVGLALGTWLNWRLVAKRFRVYTEVAGDSITLSDYFENRFRDDSRILRIVSAVFILFFFFIYTSSGFVAGAKLFNTVFGISYIPALLIGAIVILGYTVLGGFLAVSWTDLFQGTLMLIALVGVPIGVYSALGGVRTTMDAVRDINPNLLNFFANPDGSSLGFWATASLLAWGLGYPGQPHVIARFMAIRDHNEVKTATRIGVFWVVISLACSVLIGTIGIVYLKDAPLQGADVEKIFMVLIQGVFHPAVAGLFLAAILAAVMSTADSQLLVTSSAFTKDFYQVFFKRDATDEELVKVSRYSVIIVAIVAFIIALNPENKILDLVSYAWAGLGATFGPIVVMSLYWRDMNRNGAIAGMVVGGLTVIIWNYLSGGIFDIYEILPGFVFACIAIYIVSKATGGASKEIREEFNKVMKLVKQ
ncbi:MAG: sodium/proline symporter PutP [Tissierellia bacterium]|nr:sodium/proline symporter PutP [Tissierellia bacterium]